MGDYRDDNWNNNAPDPDLDFGSFTGHGVGNRPTPSRPASARNKPIYWPIVAEITAVYHVDSLKNRSAADKAIHSEPLDTGVSSDATDYGGWQVETWWEKDAWEQSQKAEETDDYYISEGDTYEEKLEYAIDKISAFGGVLKLLEDKKKDGTYNDYIETLPESYEGDPYDNAKEKLKEYGMEKMSLEYQISIQQKPESEPPDKKKTDGGYIDNLLPLSAHLGHRVECDVVAIFGIAAGTSFKRVPLCIPFGGIHNSSSIVPSARKNAHEGSVHGDGDLCIINFIGGDQYNAVITGFLPHHFNTIDGPRAMSGQTAEFNFNGLNVLICLLYTSDAADE